MTVAALAGGLGRKADYLYKVFQGRKPLSSSLAGQIQAYLAQAPTTRGDTAALTVNPADAPAPDAPALEHALAYFRLGWNVIPMRMREKRPLLPEWKSLQTRRITEAEIRRWWCEWPNAGIALVLGPVSGVFALDSDGPAGRAAMLEHLGTEPANAPKTISGSSEPDHFHLLFQCPQVETRRQSPLRGTTSSSFAVWGASWCCRAASIRRAGITGGRRGGPRGTFPCRPCRQRC